MDDNGVQHVDEWERRAAQIGPAIRRAFPVALLDRECLQKMMKDASRPLTPKGGLFTRIYAKIFPSAWVDDELLDFLGLLQNHDWNQIDWNRNWIVIPILPEVAFAYCLSGILLWAVTDPDADIVPIEGLIDFSLPRLFKSETSGGNLYLFNIEQRQVIAEVLHLFRDLSFANNPKMQKAASDIILDLDKTGALKGGN